MRSAGDCPAPHPYRIDFDLKKPSAWIILKQFLRLALLIGALFGFFGQGIAMALSPNCAAAMMMLGQDKAAHAMPMASKMDCCPDAPIGKHGSKPAKDMIPNCPMMAGGHSALAFGDAPRLLEIVQINPAIPDWSIMAQLASRSTTPEPPPPTI